MLDSLRIEDWVIVGLLSILTGVWLGARVFIHFAKISLLKQVNHTLISNLSVSHKLFRACVMQPIAQVQTEGHTVSISLTEDAINALYDFDARVADTLALADAKEQTP